MEKLTHKEEFPPLLPQGFHTLTVEDVQKRCVAGFPTSAVRADIMAGLVTILERIRDLGIVCEIWLDGSFLTEKIEPDDVDFIVFAPMSILEPERPELDEFIDWMNNNEDEPKSLFKCHTQVVLEEAQNGYANDLIADTRNHYQKVFGFSVKTHEPKGIVVLNLALPQESASESNERGDE